jgi:signal transduction histidine kinase/ligand-binding sensor domain-containing protein
MSPFPVAIGMLAMLAGSGSSAQVRIDPQPVRLPVVDARDLRFMHLSATQGMAATRVRHVLQDDEGFIWFGSEFGLNRYDGYKFRLVTHDINRVNSLGGTHVDSVFKDRSGYLWIGTDQTLDRWDTRTESVTHYRLQQADRKRTQADVVQINQDDAGMIWLATQSGALRLDPGSGALQVIRHAAGNPASLSSDDVKSTFEDREHRFWIANSAGLDEFDRQREQVVRHVPLTGPIREFSVYEDRAGLLWLGYASGGGAGLSAFDPRTNTLSHYRFRSEDVAGAAYSGVYALAEDRNGDLWIGTGGLGLLRFDRSGRRFLRYRNHPEDPDSLSEDHITSLLIDREGNLWVGLNATGPNLTDLQPPRFRHVIHTLGSQGGGEILVYCVFRDHRGDLWIGTASGLFKVDLDSGNTTFVSTADHAVSAGIASIVEDNAGDLWLGSVGQGLKRFDPRTGRVVKVFVHAEDDAHSLSDDLIEGLAFDGPGRLWISTWNGFDELDVASGRFTTHKLDPLRRTEPYNKFVRDAGGQFWISSESGLARFDPASGGFTLFTHSDAPGSISSNHVSSVFIDSRGHLWLATLDGLDELNADGSFSVYRPAGAVAANAVSCILEDDDGNLWLSTNKGIARFNLRSRTFTSYAAPDGVGDLLGWGACLKAPDGQMFFGGYTGLTAFFPERIRDIPSAAPIRLSDFRINGQTVEVSPQSPLTRSIASATEISIDPRQRNFSLEFASLNFVNSGATRYRYQLEGLDSQWNAVGSDQRVVNYTSLPPGSYVFRAQAAVGRGGWTEPGVSLQVRVLPPWWRSWWFITMAGALLLLLGWATLAYRLRSIARQYEVRLQERLLERNRIARELHDSLLQGLQGLVLRLQAVLKLLPHRASEAAQKLEAALARADEAIVEGREAVRDLRNSPAATEDLAKSLRSLGDELVMQLEEAAVAHRVVVLGEPRPLMPLLRDDIYQIAREAFRNAIQHARASSIEAELQYEDAAFHLRVRDDGVGISPQILGQTRPVGHWGLQGMQERAICLGGRLEIIARAAVGTEVHLEIPAEVVYRRSSGGRRGAVLSVL